MDKGIKTSEFWLTILTVLLGTVLSSGVLKEGGVAMQVAGIAMSILAHLGYTYSRTTLKKGVAVTTPTVAKATG